MGLQANHFVFLSLFSQSQSGDTDIIFSCTWVFKAQMKYDENKSYSNVTL